MEQNKPNVERTKKADWEDIPEIKANIRGEMKNLQNELKDIKESIFYNQTEKKYNI